MKPQQYKDKCCFSECVTRFDINNIAEYDIDLKDQQEKQNAQILSLYRQMKLQKAFEQCTGLDPNFKKNQLYTNTRLLGEIATKIDQNDVNYPQTFQGITDDINSNIILTSVQLRKQHLMTDPLSKTPSYPTTYTVPGQIAPVNGNYYAV